MHNKKTLAAIAVFSALAVSFSAQAETPKGAALYIEGQIGYANLDNIDTNTYSGTSGNVTGSNVRANFDYDSSTTYGAEVGLKDILIPNLRIGASYTTMKFDLKSAQIDGVVTAGSSTYTGPATFSASDLATGGLDFDNRVNLYMINAYYDIKTFTNLTPFIGAGIGLADVKHAKDLEFAYDLNAGVKYNINPNIYIGIKGAYTRVNGPTDQIGIKFKDIDVLSANVAVGFEF
jgi:opacity protein-like surface antigen